MVAANPIEVGAIVTVVVVVDTPEHTTASGKVVVDAVT